MLYRLSNTTSSSEVESKLANPIRPGGLNPSYGVSQGFPGVYTTLLHFKRFLEGAEAPVKPRWAAPLL
jgi:hypothetical protein